MTGTFVVIEGPNGVGKSTLVRTLAEELTRHGQQVFTTVQPSKTNLGRFLREAEETLSGRAYALALAADRYDQQAREIQPQLDTGALVLLDRYVHSSLVLQRLDGLPFAEIWTYNQYVRQPDLTLWLDNDPDVIAQRMTERGQQLTRLERTGTPALESTYYAEACQFLSQLGWTHRKIDTRDMTPQEVLASSLPHVDHSR